MENSFWNNTDGNFVELFKKSFILYVESGMKKKTEADFDRLEIQDGGYRSNRIGAEFCKFIIEHRLCRFFFFYVCSYI
jgi:hypothetical protein